ncbi:MAG: FtsW/RodA/SpoVE family cell cycle protein [Patescibacteria group bacterium]|nr:FtsW/RodA/SpoVE family cell cycle protein [Patescibacteria group bacterium]
MKKFNLTLILPTLFLTSLGLLSIYSSSISGGDFLNFKKQIIFFAFSIFLVILLNFFDLRLLKRNSYLVFGLYFLSLLFLFGLFFFGKELKGVKGWYNFGIFFFDPVPLSAIFLIIILSKYFSTRHIEIQRLQPIFFSALYAILPALLVLFQPNLGSSLILISAWLGIVIFSGLKLRHFFVLVLIFLLLFVFGWKFWLKDYQKQRILSFLNPKIDTQGISWNINQAKIAIGSGGFFGKGIGKGAQTQYGFLPASQTDFIFASLGEEIGFFGIFWFFLAFTFLFYRIIKLAFLAQDNFTRLFAAGFGFLILSQCLINIGMSLGLLPIIGIPLPFVSYGGSQLFGFYLGLGILMSLTKF